MQFLPKARQFFRTLYILEWCRGRHREIKSGKKNERTIIPKRRQGFLGLVRYYRKFIPGFGETAEPLYRLLNKSNKFGWSAQVR